MSRLTKTELKTELLKDKLAKEEEKRGGKSDSRMLPFWNLTPREQIKMVIVPDEKQNLFVKYRTHGGKLSGVKSINCAYESSGESCPACQLSFQYYNEGDKDEAAKWRSKETFISQCIPIESDIEIPENEDGNLVKLMYLPWAVKEKLTEAIMSGEIDDPSDHVFVLRASKNQGGRNSYENSYFLHKPLEDEVPKEFFEAADAGLIQPYDLEAELPAPTTTHDVQTWLDGALETVENARKAKSSAEDVKSKIRDSRNDDEDHTDTTTSAPVRETEPVSSENSTSALRERLRNRARNTADD